jgi:hypothetical protein
MEENIPDAMHIKPRFAKYDLYVHKTHNTARIHSDVTSPIVSSVCHMKRTTLDSVCSCVEIWENIHKRHPTMATQICRHGALRCPLQIDTSGAIIIFSIPNADFRVTDPYFKDSASNPAEAAKHNVANTSFRKRYSLFSVGKAYAPTQKQTDDIKDKIIMIKGCDIMWST